MTVNASPTAPASAAPAPHSRRRLWWGAALVLFLLGGVFVLNRRATPPAEPVVAPPPSPAVTAAVLAVRRGVTASGREVTGTVRSAMTSVISAKIMSRVAALYVQEGDTVRKGETLAQLDAADLTAQASGAEAEVSASRRALAQARLGLTIQYTQSATRVEQAQASVRQAQAGLQTAKEQLSVVREGSRSQQRLQAGAAVRQAEVTLRLAQTTYTRFRALYDEGVIPRQRLDELQLQMETTKAQLDSAREQESLVNEGARAQEVRQAEEGVRSAEADVRKAEEGLRMARASTRENRIKQENVQMLKAQLKQAEAGVTAARNAITFATIRAPFSGVVLRRNVDVGAMAAPGAPLLELADTSSFRLEAVVPESQIAPLRNGAALTVRIDALNADLPGRVLQVVPNGDPASRTFIVKIALPPRSGLKNGLFGRVALPGDETESIQIAETALWRQDSLTGVWVVEDGVARKRLITVGAAANGTVEVLSGLRPGEEIVRENVKRMEDGARIIRRGEN